MRMALGKYFEDNQEIIDERLRDINKTGEYINPSVVFKRSPKNKSKYYEIVPQKISLCNNVDNFCFIHCTKKAYIVKRAGRMAKLDRLNDEMLKLNAQLSGKKQSVWTIKKPSISFTDLVDLLYSLGIRILIS